MGLDVFETCFDGLFLQEAALPFCRLGIAGPFEVVRKPTKRGTDDLRPSVFYGCVAAVVQRFPPCKVKDCARAKAPEQQYFRQVST